MISVFQPDIWILQTHAAGDNEQCLALAEALDRPYVLKRLDWPADGEGDRARTRRLLSDTEEGRRWRREIGLISGRPR